MDLKNASLLRCPVCGGGMRVNDNTLSCERGHAFDVAKEGYVNLLRSGKSGDRIGDDKLSARCRRDFLNKGYYRVLQEYLTSLFADCHGTLLDICCGEGYYTKAVCPAREEAESESWSRKPSIKASLAVTRDDIRN